LPSSSKLWGTNQEQAIEYGNIFHEVMSLIKTKKDIEPVFDFLDNKGEVSKQNLTKIKSKVLEVVQHAELEACFSNEVIVYNEREIIFEDKTIIPDRLVFHKDGVTIIDYKTGSREEKHKDQIDLYGKAISIMLSVQVKKILVYLGDSLIIEKV